MKAYKLLLLIIIILISCKKNDKEELPIEQEVSFYEGLPANWKTTEWELDYMTGYKDAVSLKPKKSEAEVVALYEYYNEGYISFFLKNSSDNFPLLFYIDGTLIGEWFTKGDWKEIKYYVAAGKHVFKWVNKITDINIDLVKFSENSNVLAIGKHIKVA